MGQTIKRWSMKLSRSALMIGMLPKESVFCCVALIAAVMFVTVTEQTVLAQELRHDAIRIINASPPEQPPDQEPFVSAFTQEQLDQMLAPIALYPDELLVQVLMAATYPLEVAQAARWAQANGGLGGDQLAIALEQQDWDPSVKSLVNFPQVLQMMNDRLDWTQQLGDAFLGQEEQVMATVQQLRQRAQAQGNLVTTSEESVIVDPQSQQIMIEPAVPQVVYVPVYDPMIVFGPWWWPAYRPYYYNPRGVVVSRGVIGFGLGIRIGTPWGYAWGGFNWHGHNVVINVNRNVQINNHIDRNRYVSHVTAGSSGQGTWRHDPVHRQGVAYRAPSVAQQYGRGPRPGADTRRDYRGFEQPARHPLSQARVEPPRQPAAPAQQPRVAPAPAVARPEPPRQPVSPGRAGVQGVQAPTAFGGASPGAQTRQFSNRGRESLGGAPAGGQAPSGNRAAPRGGSPGGGAPQGGSHGNPHGGR